MNPDALPMEHILRKPVESRRAYRRRRQGIAIAMLLALVLAAALVAIMAGCGGSPPSTVTRPPLPTVSPLSAADVANLVQAAATSVDAETMAIAVVDRGGTVLAVYDKAGVTNGATDIGNFGVPVGVNDLAVALARTGAYFSNDQAPLSSRTVRFISGIHFPPGVSNAPTADLYGIENTNRGCTLATNFLPGQAINPSTALNGSFGPGIVTGKSQLDDGDPNAVNPGGVPIFRGGIVVGGIGVAGVSHDVAEYAAFTASESNGFGLPTPLPPPGAVFIGGIALPFVNQTTIPAGSNGPEHVDGGYLAGHSPIASAGPPPEGDLIAPTRRTNGGLTLSDVQTNLNDAEATANKTRAAIRLPLEFRARMAIAVADLDGTLIGLRRMPDATVFSIDVAVGKARNVVYFNGPNRTANDLPGVPMGTAVTNRTIGFGSQPLFPPGIDGIGPRPFLQSISAGFGEPVHARCAGGRGQRNRKAAWCFFPAALALYKNGVLVGGLGISGDGVDQDDFVTSGGSVGYEAPTAIRADQILINGVRLPYFKFPTESHLLRASFIAARRDSRWSPHSRPETIGASHRWAHSNFRRSRSPGNAGRPFFLSGT